MVDGEGANDGSGRPLSDRVNGSAWAASVPGLAPAVAELERTVGDDQRRLADRAVEAAQPGRVDPRRLARHAAAASFSRMVRMATQLPNLVATRHPLADPQGWLLHTSIQAFVDQLVLGGAASAELARLIDGGGALFPAALRAELERRDLRPLPVPEAVVQRILDDEAAVAPGDGTRLFVDGPPVTRTPVSQLHQVETDDGRSLLARVRRPRIARDLHHDARLAAGAAMAIQRIAPDSGGMGPLGFVRLTLRQTLESTDLRFEALDLVELGLIVEAAGVTGLTVARPLPVRMSERALTLDHPHAFAIGHGPPIAPQAAAALIAITLESALVRGRFWADPAPEHLLVDADGGLVLVGVGTLGRFTPALRLAGVRTLKGVLTGDFNGMIEGMAIAGALSPDVDTERLLAELAASDALNPMTILRGGEGALLGALSALVGLLLANKLEPPVEVTLLLRTIFAVGRLIDFIAPEGMGLAGALMNLLPRLPQLLAEAEAETGLG